MHVLETCRKSELYALFELYDKMARIFTSLPFRLVLFFGILFTIGQARAKYNNNRSNSLSHNDQHNEDAKLKKQTATKEGLKNSLASGFASFCSKALLQPFDTIKTVQQHYNQDGSSTTSLKFIQAAQLIMERKYGIRELYAGFFVSALGGVPSIALYYGVYSYCKGIFIPLMMKTKDGDEGSSSRNTRNKLLAVAISAAIGNTIASFSRVPYEVVKQKLQTGVCSSTLLCMRDMFEADGLRAFFPMGGVPIQMLRDIPYAIFTLVAYEFLQDSPYILTFPSPLNDMMAGGMAGGFGTFMTNGLDVIKTRLQTNPELYNGSIMICAQILVEQGGWSIFLRGSPSRLLYKIPNNAIFFVFYEFFKRILRCDSIRKK